MFYAYIFKNLEGNELYIKLSRFFFKRITLEHHEVNIKILQFFLINLAEIIF